MIFCLPLAAAVLAGCGGDLYAKRIITPDAAGGRLSEDLAGTGEKLVSEKRIDLARRIDAPDGTPLDVWVIKGRRPAPDSSRAEPGKAVVILHGLGESKANYLGIAQRLARPRAPEAGLDVVLIDLRAHGRSGGDYFTYGGLEKLDVKAVVDALAADKTIAPDEVYVLGVTLGGATAIQYAAADPRVKGVMAVAPYKDARSFARWRMFISDPAMSEADFAKNLSRAGELAHFDPDDASALKAARTATCPLLLVHSTLDMAVPFDHSKAIYEAWRGPRKLEALVPGQEQIVWLVWDEWVAKAVAEMARGNLETPLPTTRTATAPAAPR